MVKELLTRNECRQLGLNVCNTQFLRYEEQGLLTPIKVGNLRSAVVRYRVSEVYALLGIKKSA
jgi:hypothetical protein